MSRRLLHMLIRTDAAPKHGLGHLTRCIALALEFRARGWHVYFCVNSGGYPLPFLLRRDRFAATLLRFKSLHQAGGKKDLRQVHRLGGQLSAKVVLVDSYDITPAYLRQLTASGYFVIRLDDLARQPGPAHVIINGNIGAERLRYRCRPDSLVLAGNRFALIRREIRTLRRRLGHLPVRSRASRVLICLGGSDPCGQSLRVLRWLETVPETFSVDVLTTRYFRHRDRLRRLASRLKSPVRIHCEPVGVGRLMRSCDLAITAAGVTSYELACLGVPFLVFKLYDNQCYAHRYLVRRGIALNAGDHGKHSSRYFISQFQRLLSNAELRRQIQRRAFRAFDGRGPERVVRSVTRAFQAQMARA